MQLVIDLRDCEVRNNGNKREFIKIILISKDG